MQLKNPFRQFVILLALSFLVTSTFAQTRRASNKPAPSRLTAALPTSDAIAVVKIKRVLDDAMPKLLVGSPAKLAEINSQIEQFKTRTGLDPRSFDEIVFGLRYSYPTEGVTKINTIAIASGSFSSAAMVAAGRIATNGKYQEREYHGKTIYIFSLDQQIRVLGLLDLKITDLAVTPLDANTLALGDLSAVRETIDAKRGRARTNAELIALASRDPNAIAGFGGNFPPELRNNLSITNDAIMKDLTAVRQFYGSVGVTEKDLELMLAAKTVDEFAARNLGSTVEALKQFGSFLVNRLPAAKAALAKSALNSLTITNQGNELLLKTAVSQAEIAPLIAGR